MQYRDIPLDSLLLDSENPRLPETHGQREIIVAHIEKARQKLLTLAQDIVSEGSLSPIDIPYVIRNDKAYVVVEGNRRIAALKLLSKPDLADDPGLSAQLKKLAINAELPDTIHCAVATSRDEARHWIILRHTGANEGAGVVGWDAAMRERFNRTSGTQSGRALVLLDELEKAFSSDASLTGLIEAVRDRQLTLLGRFVGDPAVRRRFGLVFEDDSVKSHFGSGSLRPSLKHVLEDIAEGTVTSRSLNSKDQRAEYLASLEDELPVETERTHEALPLGPAGKTPSRTPTPKRRRRAKLAVLFGNLSLVRFPDKVDDILREIQKLDVERFPYSVAVLIRVLIELCIYDFHDAMKWERPKDLKSGIRKCADTIDRGRKEPKLVGVRTGLGDGHSMFAVKTIQAYLHNPHFHASPGDLRSIASNYEYLLQQLNDGFPT